uniref:Protein kinase-like domain, concanavalin A-like lectin/glucanase domain protein n=1 Tax=Tanacetum cinerariifolium TaxID=118510 RepID=A0A699IHE2_TANCI|nr:hypothetical protein [Tanacetum cinerariifolium]
MGDENPIRTLGDYSRPSHEGYSNTIELPKGNNVTKDQSKEEDGMEINMDVEEVIEEKESEFKTDKIVKEIFNKEEEDEYDEIFNSFPTMKELSHHEWLWKHPRPPSIIDRHLGEMVFGKPFIDKTGLVYSEENRTVVFKQGDEIITFKIRYTMEIFKQTWLMGFSVNYVPPSIYEENFGLKKMHYHQSLLIGEEYKEEGGTRGIRHLIRLEKEMMDDKGEVT